MATAGVFSNFICLLILMFFCFFFHLLPLWWIKMYIEVACNRDLHWLECSVLDVPSFDCRCLQHRPISLSANELNHIYSRLKIHKIVIINYTEVNLFLKFSTRIRAASMISPHVPVYVFFLSFCAFSFHLTRPHTVQAGWPQFMTGSP